MATEADSSRWALIRARKLADPATRERYERTRRSVAMTRQVLQVIDAERVKAGLSKADLAQRIGTSPSVVRRLLTSDTSNPTLKTVLGILDALDVQFILRPRAPRRQTRLPRRLPPPPSSPATVGA